MKYSEVNKVLFNAGFTNGIRNVRKLEKKGFSFTASFSDVDNILVVYLSVHIGNSRESSHSVIIPSVDSKQFEKQLDEIIQMFSVACTKFEEAINEGIEDLKFRNIVKAGH